MSLWHSIFLLSLLAAACGARSTPVGSGAASAHEYVSEHRSELERDASIGSGDAIYELSVVLGCQNVPELGRALRKKHDVIFGPADTAGQTTLALSDTAVTERLLAVIETRPELRCLDLDTGRTRMFSAGRQHVFGVRCPECRGRTAAPELTRP